MDQISINALLAAGAYWDIRFLKTNQAPIPPGWKVLTEFDVATSGDKASTFGSAFSARVFQGPNGEIVISYAGTEFPEGITPGLVNDFISGNLPLATGSYGKQAYDAALVYQKVQARYGAGANISFTGHSLGGGLAGLMAVWFDRAATVFDPAPFELAGREIPQPFVMAPAFSVVMAALAAQGYHDEKFDNYRPLIDFSTRESRVVSYAIKGEILELLDYLLLPRIEASRTPKLVGAAPDLSGGDKHSIDLLAAVLLSTSFETVATALPDVLPLLFDHGLYGPIALGLRQNLLVKLLRGEVGVYDEVTGVQKIAPTELLTKFTADLNKLAYSDEGMAAQGGIRKALIVAAMEYYYFKDAASATALFTVDGNGIHFNYSDVGEHNAPLKSPDFMDRAIKACFDSNTSDLLSIGMLQDQTSWHIQSGAGGMVWNGGPDAVCDVAVGGVQADVLSGGGGADLLIGGEGDDTLNGGAGTDMLAGGAGNDTYQFTGAFRSDTIVDSDGLGRIQVDGSILQGGKKVEGLDGVWRNQEQGYTFTLAGSGADRSLLITKDNALDAIRIKGWQDGQLGLTMDGVPAPPLVVQHTYLGDQRPEIKVDVHGDLYYDWSSTSWASDGSLTGGLAEENSPDVIVGTLGSDRISGLGGKDVLQGWLGDDEIDGGGGDDLIAGGPGRDLIHGGVGNDVIMGAGNFYFLDYDQNSYASVRAWNPVFGVNALAKVQFDPVGMNQWVNGTLTWIDLTHPDPDVIGAGDGDDLVFGSAYDDAIAGDAGNDVLWGLEGNDIIVGGTGGDVLVGDVEGVDYALLVTVGGDIPQVVYGKDFLDGGDGDDTLLGGGAGDALFGGGGNDVLAGDGSSVLLLDGSYVNQLAPQGRQGDDYLDGGDGDDVLTGAGGNDVLVGGAGADTLDGGSGDDSFSAGTGDTVTDSGGIDSLILADGEPASVAVDNADLLLGYGNRGTLRIVDALRGSVEFIDGARLEDWLNSHLSDGVTVASTGEGQNLSGGAGGDTLEGGHSHARLAGGRGNDTYVVGSASSTVLELADEGTDTVQSARSQTLAENVENLTLTGTAAISGAGNALGNVLIGNAAANVLTGGAGDDSLDGGSGNDLLYGEGGDDLLYASYGNDTLAGGEGLDTYVLGYSGDLNTVVDGSAEGSVVKLGSAGMKFEDLSAVRRADDLVVEVRGISASMRIKDYYTASEASWVFEDADGNTTTGEALVEASRTDWGQLRANLLEDFQSGALGSISRDYADSGYTQRADGSWYRPARYAMSLTAIYEETTDFFKNVHTQFLSPSSPWVTITSDVPRGEWITNQTGQPAEDAVVTVIYQAKHIASGTEDLESTSHSSNVDTAWSPVHWVSEGSNHGESQWVYQSSHLWPGESPTERIDVYARYDLDRDFHEGTASQLTFQNPGDAALVGHLPDYIAVEFLHRQYVYNLGPSLLADGDQTVWADRYSAVIGGAGNNTIYGAGFAYGGTGNAQLMGGGTLMAGTGDQYLQFGETMVVGDGHDTVVGYGGSRILVDPRNRGVDLIGQDFDWESDSTYWGQSLVIERVYQAMGFGNWEESYQYGGKYYFDAGEDSKTYFDSMEEARAAFIPTGYWPTFDIALTDPYTSWGYVEPLPALYKTPYTSVEYPASGLAASSYYAAHGITPKMLKANDFSALRPLFDAELLPQGVISFGPGLSLADLTLSWGEVGAPLDGETHVTLNILWGADQGLRVMMPKAGDALNSVVQRFEFADGTVSSLADLVALAPPMGTWVHVNAAPTGGINLVRNGIALTDAANIRQGDILTSADTLADTDGMGAFNYQWQRFDGHNWTDIRGATADSLTLTPGLCWNKVRLAVTYTDGFGAKESVLSAATGMVNQILGTAGDDTLIDSGGFGQLRGGAGDDTYIVGGGCDFVDENANEGVDTVTSSVDYTIRAHIEFLTLAGTALNGTGNAEDNTLTGNDGNNWLMGSFGADTLIGGAGDDMLDGAVANDASTVWMTVTSDHSAQYYAYGGAIHTLALTDSIVPFVGTGQSLRFQYGMSGSFQTYVAPGTHVDLSLLAMNQSGLHLSGRLADYSQTIEQVSGTYTFSRMSPEGYSESATVTLANTNALLYFADGYVEFNLSDPRFVCRDGYESFPASPYTDFYMDAFMVNPYISTCDPYASFSAEPYVYTFQPIRQDWLMGGEQDWIEGIPVIAQGADRLEGGLGNDRYDVDDPGDVVIELAGEGTDTVQASVSYTLAANVENLTLTGSASINGTGNDLANVLRGNAGNNLLAGGAGGDVYAAGRGMGQDRVSEDDVTPGATDELLFGEGVTPEQLWFRHVGNDLEVSIIGTADKATVQDWYLGGQHHVEHIKVEDGKVLLDSQVETLVQAMAAYAPPATGQMDLSAGYAAALAPVIGAVWH